MSTPFSRRTLLKSALAGAACAPLALALGREQEDALAFERLTDDIGLITGAGANVVVARGPDGLALVDGGLESRSAELLELARREMGGAEIRTLFNTHWHPEQTGSNTRLGKAGVKIIAHENTRLWLGYPNPLPGKTETYGPLPPFARPNATLFHGSAQLALGEEQLEYGYLLQAHTDGDIYVRFRKANILVTGGVVSGEGWPLIDYKTGGWIGGLVAGVAALIKLCDADTRVVPANGPLLTRADLEAQHKMYTEIFARLRKSLSSGLGPDEAIALAPTKEYDAKMGDPQLFLMLAFRSLWGHFSPDA